MNISLETGNLPVVLSTFLTIDFPGPELQFDHCSISNSRFQKYNFLRFYCTNHDDLALVKRNLCVTVLSMSAVKSTFDIVCTLHY